MNGGGILMVCCDCVIALPEPQVSVNVYVPECVSVTICDPLKPFVPVQPSLEPPPLAMHGPVLVDQVS